MSVNGIISKAGICRIPHPDGGFLEIKTGGNIDLGSGEDFHLAAPKYKLDTFFENMEKYSHFFSKPNPNLKADPSSGAE